MTEDASDDAESPPTPRRGARFGTRAVHADGAADPATGARAPPLYQTTSYAFEDAGHAADLYALEREGHIYSRISNPTVERLEDAVSSLHDAPAAVATASGMAALDALTLVLAEAGDTVVCSNDTYGGTTAYLAHTAARRGIDVEFVDTLDVDAYREAIDDDTAYVHVETVGNPSLVTPDFDAVADVAHEHGVPLVADNTFATPALCRPGEHGVDVVWESTTKWLHGSGTTVGGVVVDTGNFDWRAHDYPEVAGPNPAYPDTDFAEHAPDAPLAAAVRYRSLRSLGDQQSPFDAWQTIQGLQTLELRMDRHCENARVVAEYLDDHDAVDWVTHPGLDSHPTHDNASKYLDGGYSGMIAFGLHGSEGDEGPDGYAAGKRFCERVELASFLANIGDAKTLVIHPASTTHAQLSPDEQADAGVTPDLVRLSVGIEDPADLLADLDAAIESATGETATDETEASEAAADGPRGDGA
ncbi:O-acetylhomoserine aminocarboxypropyltransferase/cysteine synthase [Halorubellus sp. JP-L1]|uniref:O-acetylhomoserine aminocarboxypropyltransferase/cysteine synthase family protein n=1 Tax=Halorubellus sp. JP-L1 TaxID=2715753 RepID=UPI0014081828|nr:O-acetylhomoserine aminocarboxypropyltransferase/cysteine synthase family protein [Halorubellus sp. JP-L1]NHN43361.1 O-acetylhomoserine aminocarboxypropyltransferase/cysteine synthase [Halorubellus sp. JP-L1]